MHERSDVQLLRAYADGGSEAAFREIVARHTDFVYSAAFRQLASSAAACDLAQSVFTDLARKAPGLAEKIPDAGSLAGWLHRATRYAALNHLRDDHRRRDHERQAMEQLLTNSESPADWEQIRPALDEALDSLADEDREALLLRYFKNQDFRAVGRALGVSDDAAQKRVSRAVERLREFFAKRGVTVGAGGLAVLISANAVQAAPVGLAATISAAAILAGTAVKTSTVIAATKTIAMTTLQKTLITATVAVLAGTGIYEARQAAQLRAQNQTLQQQQAEQIQQRQRERDDAANRLAASLMENKQPKTNRDALELLKLRGEVGLLRQQTNELGNLLARWQSAAAAARPQPSTNQIKLPRQSWGFAGYDTPEAAIESTLWAKSQGDEKQWYAGLASTNTIQAIQSNYVQGKTDEERAQFLQNETKNWTGLQILNTFPLADDQVEVQVQVEFQPANGSTQNMTSLQVMKKIDGQWKLVSEYMGEGFPQ